MRTGNPALRDGVFVREPDSVSAETMTIRGVIWKTMLLLLLALATGAVSWNLGGMGLVLGLGGAVVGLIIALVLGFKHTLAPFLAPAYALAEGFFLGGISAYYAGSAYSGIVIQAIGLTFAVLFALLGAYQTGLIKATENFKLGVVAATGAIALFYAVSMVLGFFGIQVPMIHDSGLVGIGFSVFVIIIAALNLVLDFDFIENGEAVGAPKYMEWYAAFGLMVTLVWLYIEILRLLSKLNRR